MALTFIRAYFGECDALDATAAGKQWAVRTFLKQLGASLVQLAIAPVNSARCSVGLVEDLCCVFLQVNINMICDPSIYD